MGMDKYVIKTLLSEDYDKLPYKYIRESDGVTDRFFSTAFVRQTDSPDYDMDSVIHEIEEMTTDKWKHSDEFGVRYKFKIGSFLKNIAAPIALSFIPGVGPVLAGLYSGINNYQTTGSYGKAALSGGLSFVGGKLAQGTPGFQAGVAGSKAAGGGIIGQTLSGAQGTAAGLLKSLPGFGAGGSLSGVTNWATPSVSKVAELGLPQAGQGLSSFGSPAKVSGAMASPNVQGSDASVKALLSSQGEQVGGLSSGMNAAYNASKSAIPTLASFNIGGAPVTPSLTGMENLGSQSSISPTSMTQPTSVLDKIFKSTPTTSQSDIDWGKIATGGAVSMAGNALAPKTEMPTSDYLNQLKAGGLSSLTPAGKLANKSVTDVLNTQWTGLPQEYKDSLTADLTYNERDEERALRAEYKSLRPNADIENDTAFNRDFRELKDKQKMRRDNLLAKAEQQEWERFNDQKTATISQAMGIDQQTLNQYMELANTDLQIIMFKTGLSYGEAQSFKDTFGQIGGTIMQAGLPSANLGKFSVNLG